uniref:Uncharacterized protein n=1 Tax=Triticum urartu TaxID=4572 RepID=A0A8R7RAP1_TRIUA
MGRLGRTGRAGGLAEPLAEALALEVRRVALAVGEVIGAADGGAVAAAEAGALEVVALRHAVPRLRHLGRRRPHLCMHINQTTVSRASSSREQTCSRARQRDVPVATRRTSRRRAEGALRRESAIGLLWLTRDDVLDRAILLLLRGTVCCLASKTN